VPWTDIAGGQWSSKLLYSFESYTVDTDRRELRRGTDLICVEPQVFDLLEYLIRNRQRVVSKDDLIAAIWGGRIVSESALTTRINAARSAIGDSGKEQRLIRTLRRKGVRFVGAVRGQDAAAAHDTSAAAATEPTGIAPGQSASAPAEIAAEHPGPAPIVVDSPSNTIRSLAEVSERRQLTVMACQLVGPPAPVGHILSADAAGYSRMMYADESGTLALLQRHRCEVIDPAIARHRGRTVKLMGDGILVEFASVVEAVDCAAEIQRAMVARNAGFPSQRRTAFRIGVHLGDVIVEGNDLYGDGVNVAARLEGIAEHGGVCISRRAYDQVQKNLPLRYRSLGRLSLKNIPDPVEVFAIQGDGLTASDDRQEIGYCRAVDGVRLAYAISGHGPPLVKAGNWLNHLEYDWESPIWRSFLVGLSRDHRLIRYDPRGTGLSDWDVSDISLDAWVSDIASVTEAAGVDRFPLLGYSQGCAVSIAYAVKYPGRVSHLILYGGFALGACKRGVDDHERRKAMVTLMRLEWGSDNPAIRQMFATVLMPDASRQQADTFNELQRQTTSAEGAARYFETAGEIDIVALLPQVRVPTLIMHARGDLQVPAECGRQLAAGIAGAKFVMLQGNNHILLEQDPATHRFFEEVNLFLAK
jgi:class 3 adenylate cyclase/DNA-binding winged helix-turn-helix (wHTH) protein/pimeloyl-ACP methyl ester carboxylesterase